MALSEDILPSVEAIAEYVYGEANKSTARRVRHLIAVHNFPVKRVGARLESRKSWIDDLYAKPDGR